MWSRRNSCDKCLTFVVLGRTPLDLRSKHVPTKSLHPVHGGSTTEVVQDHTSTTEVLQEYFTCTTGVLQKYCRSVTKMLQKECMSTAGILQGYHRRTGVLTFNSVWACPAGILPETCADKFSSSSAQTRLSPAPGGTVLYCVHTNTASTANFVILRNTL